MRPWTASLLSLVALGCGKSEPPIRGTVAAASNTHRAVPPASGSSSPPSPAAPTQSARTATILAHTRHGVLWSDGARLRAFSFDSRTNSVLVTMPRKEAIACAAWSADGALLAAVSVAGSVALWNRAGTLLSELANKGSPGSCGDSMFTFASSSQRVLVRAGLTVSPLLGAGVAVPIVEDHDLDAARFSADGRFLLASIEREDMILLVDALSGKRVAQIPAMEADFAFSPDGRHFFVRKNEDQVSVYDTEKHTLIAIIPGYNPTFQLDLLVVSAKRENPDEHGDSTAYTLEPFATRWERRNVWLYDGEMNAGVSRDAGPFVIGSSQQGYSVFDVRTGERRGAWRGSGYGCGYHGRSRREPWSSSKEICSRSGARLVA